MIVIYKTQELTTVEQRHYFADVVASRLWGTTVKRDGRGKPMLESGVERISISHTEGHWVVMSASRECGIDCELISRRTQHLAHKFLGDSEREVCESLWAENPTLLGWCVKEAVYKYMGVEGVDFRRDMVILSGEESVVEVAAMDQIVSLKWGVVGDLLVVYTI